MIDLHTHSHYSDGTLSPADLIRQAAQAGLSAVALCDHNTLAGLPEFLAAARDSGLEGVPGVEVSADYGDREVHIVGLYVYRERCETLQSAMDEMLVRKERSNAELVAALDRAGLELDYERIRRGTQDGFVNRAVIAAEMVRLGYVSSVREAFSRWLRPEHGYFIPPKRPDAFEVIRMLKAAGAAAILAHPFLNFKQEELPTFLTAAKQAGLDGMETRYSTYDERTRLLSSQMAERFDLLESGGSDFHGANKPDIQVGIGRGDLCVPDRFLWQIRRLSME